MRFRTIKWSQPIWVIGIVALGLWACSDDTASGDDNNATTIDTGQSDVDGDLTDIQEDDSGSDVSDRDDVADDALADTGEDTQPDSANRDVEDNDDADAEIVGPVLTIVIEGSDEDLELDDGFASQTPDPYFYGLQRLEMLESAEDTTPAVVFDYGPSHELVDMHGRTEVARVAIEDLADGTYTHFRILLTLLDVRILADLHDVPVVTTLNDLPLDVLYALSDFSPEGRAMEQGDVIITGSFGGQTISIPMTIPLDYPEPSPGAWAESIDGQTFVTFALANPLTISSSVTDNVTYVIRFFVEDSFRWTEQGRDGYTAGKWDVTLGATNERVERFGANGFEIEVE